MGMYNLNRSLKIYSGNNILMTDSHVMCLLFFLMLEGYFRLKKANYPILVFL